ncbi:MAG: SDR family oxidoreductase [Gammaproteobacteria bacterium]|nr:SDR family oxidoreductase [Gammaproteobacteria bacterium]
MISRFEDKMVFVSGASSGIGEAVVEALLNEGVSVVGASRRKPKLNDAAGFYHVEVDFSDLDQLPRRLKEIAKQYDNISAIVSCAGAGQFGSIEEFSFDQIDKLIQLNLTSHIFVAKQFVPALRKLDSSDVIFIGSEAAVSGGRRGAVYSASKFGLRGFSQALRDECAKSGVRVSLINPGMVKTPFFDRLSFRPGKEEENYIEPADVANVVKMVLSTRPGTVFDEINLSPLKKVVDFQSIT